MSRRPGLPFTLSVALWLATPAAALGSWEPAKPVSNAGAGFGAVSQSASVELRNSDVAVGANGLATAVFFQQTGGQVVEPYFARRPAGAGAWSAPVKGTLPAPSTTSPSPAELGANAMGDVFAAWQHGQSLQTARWASDAAGPAPSVAFPQTGSRVRVALDDQGNGYAALEVQGVIYLARFDVRAGTWSAPSKIADGQRPDIAVNSAGDVVVTYMRPGAFPDFLQGLYATLQLAGESKPQEKRLDTLAAGEAVSDHAVAIADDGAVTAVYTAGRPVLERAYARRWGPDGKLGGQDLLSSPRPAYYPAASPAVAVDAAGRVTAAWRQQESPLRYRIYAAERVDERGFDFPQRVSPANEHLTDDESSSPSQDVSHENERAALSFDLGVDDAGTATIVYTDSLDGQGSEPDVKAARRATGGRWTEPVSLRAAGHGPVVIGTADVAATRPGQADVVFAQQLSSDPLASTVALFATRFEGPPPQSGEHQTMVTSWHEDRTQIMVHWCPAAGLEPGKRAPTIIAGSGWGIPGRRCAGGNSPEEEIEAVFGSTPVKAFTDAGYNVLTFDARGFWRSGGTAQVDSPAYEGQDMRALIDYVARQPEALLDTPGDPRLGMSGGSYGGGIQLVTAAIDHRVDAIAPAIAWNSLVTSLFPRETVKAGWAAILVGAAVPMTTLPGVLSPAGIQDGHMAQQVYDATTTAVQSGTIDPETRAWFDGRGPHSLLDRIEAPTLLIQGTVDTMFPLDEAHRNFEALKAAGTEVKMLWFCGGHGACERHGADASHVNARVLGWFDQHLRGRDVATGPEFEWVDEEGAWHGTASYPPRFDAILSAAGSGTLSLTPGEQPGSGGVIFATPYSFRADHPAAIDVPIEAPAQETTVLGAPRLRATYTATGVTTYGTGVEGAAADRTYVYAQIVDNTRHRVVGNQATPIPITLDGEQHEISLPLERIASRSPKAGYSLQIVPQTSVYDGQRAAGTIDFHSIDITLPVDLGVDLGGASPGGTKNRRPGIPSRRVGKCHGLDATITGTRGDDVITGTRGRDVIASLAGSDAISGLGGRDVLCSGRGRDSVVAGAGNDRVFAGGGRDRVRGGRGADRLRGESGNDRLAGGDGADRLYGGAGSDRLIAGAGKDRLFGGGSRDVLNGLVGTDVLRGGAGTDRILNARK